MTTIVKRKPIRALLRLSKMTDGVVGPILDSSLKGLSVNTNVYSKPPIDLPIYGNAIAAYKASIPAALDGSKTAVALKKRLRDVAIKMYVQLAHYVEANCNDDLATFLLSGIQAKSSTKTLTPPVSDAIRKVEQGKNSGQLVVTLLRYRGASSHELGWSPVPPGGTPNAWSSQPVTNLRTATTVSGLTPGMVYAFRVRALTKTGYTDWSHPVT